MELTNGTSVFDYSVVLQLCANAKIYVTNVKNDNTTAGPNTILKRAIRYLLQYRSTLPTNIFRDTTFL